MISDRMMARGRSRFAFFASSPAVDAASKPMKLKNTWPAAALIPSSPNGANGSKFPGVNVVKAITQKNSRMPIFRKTMMVLTLADSEAPRSSRNAQHNTTTTAGMLNTPPPSPGGLANWAGISIPHTLRNSLRYCPQPTATAATETPYSNIRHQPQTQAINSPKVA